jgi:hypothetical protein
MGYFYFTDAVYETTDEQLGYIKHGMRQPGCSETVLSRVECGVLRESCDDFDTSRNH